MSIPFGRLMEYAASLTEEDLKEPLGQLAARAGVFPERLADAMAAARSRVATVRMPFERLMEYAAGIGGAEDEMTMGELAGRVGEDAWRLADAVDAVRVLRGERTYVSPVDIRAAEDPLVARALAEDRGGVASGTMTALFGPEEIPGI